MKKFTFPVILLVVLLIVIFGSNFDQWPESTDWNSGGQRKQVL